MEQYIKKSALVAEIESLKSAAETMLTGKTDLSYWKAQKHLCERILSFLDILEVKEVDLEDEIDDAKDLAIRDIAWKVHTMICEGKGINEIDHYVCGICDF